MRNHSFYLDAVRGLAAMAIVFLHTWLYADPDTSGGAFDLIFHELRLGLICFFVLSGFLLYRSWLADSAPAIGGYFKKRLARILPAYYFALIGAFAVMAIFAPDRLPEAAYWPVFLVLGQNFFDATVGTVNPPTWTLAIEMSFYLALPLFGYLALRLARNLRSQIILPITLIAFSLAFNYFFARDGVMPRVLVFSLPTMLYYFAAGMTAAVVWQYRRSLAHRWLYLIAGLGLIAVNILIHLHAEMILIKTLRDLPAAFGFALILLALPTEQPARSRSLLRPLGFLGLISYGLYLWHMPILIALSRSGLLPASVPLALLLVVPVTIIAGAVSWYLIEKPFISRSHAAPAAKGASQERRPLAGSALLSSRN